MAPNKGRRNKTGSGLSYTEELAPATCLTRLGFLASKEDRAHTAVLVQLIKVERATRHQSTVN